MENGRKETLARLMEEHGDRLYRLCLLLLRDPHLAEDAVQDTPAEPELPAKEHWAQPYYDSLIAKGVEINETRFDDPVTRGEALALLDQIVK